jgi:tetratricopeptide (TPR) repeat protein
MYDRAAEIYRTAGDVDPVLISNLGSTYAKLGQHESALEIHLRVLEMRRAIKDVPGQAITLRNIGECYGHLGNKTKALEFYNQSLDSNPRKSQCRTTNDGTRLTTGPRLRFKASGNEKNLTQRRKRGSN